MGQENCRRALEIAAAGSHNLLLIGSPGAGKDAGPPPALDSAGHDPAGGAGSHRGLVCRRSDGSPPSIADAPSLPRAPSHRICRGPVRRRSFPVLGKSHYLITACCFLTNFRISQGCPGGSSPASGRRRSDHYPGFGHLRLPSRFMLVCAMNPCRCGWYGHPSGRCTCTDAQVQKNMCPASPALLLTASICTSVCPAWNTKPCAAGKHLRTALLYGPG